MFKATFGQLTLAISTCIMLFQFLARAFLFYMFVFVGYFECGPCDYFHSRGFPQNEFFENCRGTKQVANSSNILEKHSVYSLMECLHKCISFDGCKGVDYLTSTKTDNCNLFYFRYISACLNDSSVQHYDKVSYNKLVSKGNCFFKMTS